MRALGIGVCVLSLFVAISLTTSADSYLSPQQSVKGDQELDADMSSETLQMLRMASAYALLTRHVAEVDRGDPQAQMVTAMSQNLVDAVALDVKIKSRVLSDSTQPWSDQWLTDFENRAVQAIGEGQTEVSARAEDGTLHYARRVISQGNCTTCHNADTGAAPLGIVSIELKSPPQSKTYAYPAPAE